MNGQFVKVHERVLGDHRGNDENEKRHGLFRTSSSNHPIAQGLVTVITRRECIDFPADVSRQQIKGTPKRVGCIDLKVSCSHQLFDPNHQRHLLFGGKLH